MAAVSPAPARVAGRFFTRAEIATLAIVGGRATTGRQAGSTVAIWGWMQRLAWFVALACGACGGGPAAVTRQQTKHVLTEYSATRWIPAHPTYAWSARTVRDALQAAGDFFDSFGIPFELDVRGVGHALAQVLVIDPLAPDALSGIGVDLAGGVAMFSESISPTVVVHLSSPDQLTSFLQAQRERGMKTQSQIAETKVEVFSTRVSAKLTLSWAIDGDWLWLHFGLDFERGHERTGTEWFTASRNAAAPAWGDDWKRAATQTAKLVGFVDLATLLAKLPKVDEAVACVKLLAPVGHLGFAIEGNGTHAGLRLSADLGAASAGVAKAILPPPEGWDATAAKAPLAAQWNLDLRVVQNWVAPCVKFVGIDPSRYDSYGVRAARVLLMSFEPDDKSGTGAVALDLASTAYVRSLLDDIPLRSTLESSKAFGPYQGRSLSVPFGPTIEYVLTDTMALAGVGQGVLSNVVGRGPGAPSTRVFGIDVLPAGLTKEAWDYLFSLARISGGHAIERMQRWRDLHLGLTVDGSRLVLTAEGDRQ